MPSNAPYEYKVVPAPRAARRIKGARGAQERFARTLEEILGEEAVDGWEFLRAEHLEIDEKRSWLSRARPAHRSVLVFRRARAGQMQMQGQMQSAPMHAPPQGRAPASAAAADPDSAWARAHSVPPAPGFAEPAAPALQPAPAPAAVREEEPVLRLAPAGQPASLRADPEVHPDPAAPRIGPADR